MWQRQASQDDPEKDADKKEIRGEHNENKCLSHIHGVFSASGRVT